MRVSSWNVRKLLPAAALSALAMACSIDARILMGPLDSGTPGLHDSGGTTDGNIAGLPDSAPDALTPPPLTWITIQGGSFAMGGDDAYGGDVNMPIHTVTVPTFEMMMTEVTVAAYDACYSAGQCQLPLSAGASPTCTWTSGEPQAHPTLPIDCIDWYDARQFCGWENARLPSEAEWEYAARSQGQATTYPWGDADPTCQLVANTAAGCSASLPDPVCSHPEGNTTQGLCDMAGNVWEQVEDVWVASGYASTPTDGSPQETAPAGAAGSRVERGGGFNDVADALRNVFRDHLRQDTAGFTLGFRCARSGTP